MEETIKVEIKITRTGALNAAHRFCAVVSQKIKGQAKLRETVGRGTTAAEAARIAIGWHVHDVIGNRLG